MTDKTCPSCVFYAQEWHLDWTNNGNDDIQMFLQLDNYCRLCGLFKRTDGFCDFWEKE